MSLHRLPFASAPAVGAPRLRRAPGRPALAPPLLSAALAFVALPAQAAGQSSGKTDDSGWDTTLARGDAWDLEFETSSGTFLSIDVSPDGSTLVFDLLGHLYRLPSEGGRAECLTQDSGVAVNYHPRFSPDGGTIAFISDRGGQANLWLMDADGGDPRPVHEDGESRVVTPAWLPDGRGIVARRSTLSRPRASGLYLFHPEGGSGVELVGDDFPRAGWPAPSPDGAGLYFHFAPSRERDPVRGAMQIRRLDLSSGAVYEVTAGQSQQQYQGSSGGAIAPEPSPDGRYLAFARRIPGGVISWKGHRFGPRTALFLRDLATGAERLLADPIETDMAEGMKTERVLPGYAWTKDSRHLYVARGGRIHRVDAAAGESTEIPFTATVRRRVSGQARAHLDLSGPRFRARMLRWPAVSPDGSLAVFHAAGRLYRMELPDGAPRRLLGGGGEAYELAPAFSPDGSTVAYVSWEDTVGHLWTVPAEGGAPTRLTEVAGEYLHPVWTPDGDAIVVARGSGATARGRSWSQNLWYDLARVPASGGEAAVITRTLRPYNGGRPLMPRRQIVAPSFGPEGRLFFPEQTSRERAGRPEEVTELVSVRPDGSDRQVHLTFPHADEAAPSPDGRFVAFAEGDNVYLTALPWPGTGGEPPHLERRRAVLPIRTVTTDGGMFPRWTPGGLLTVGSGPRITTYDPDSGETTHHEVDLRLPRRRAAGSLLLRGGRLVTLGAPGVVEEGAVRIVDGWIACVGACEAQPDDRVVEVPGKTLIPGLIDMHAHHHRDHTGVLPRRNWEAAIYLAYGITTTLDNSQWSQNVFSAAELVEAGEMVGPRMFSTGDPMYSGDGPRQNEITSYEDAENDIERLTSWGATAIKSYLQPRRDQRQWIADLARKRNLMLTGEGGSLVYNLGLLLDGQTGWEHPLSYVPLYEDAARFFGRTRAVYSITFVVGGPSVWNEEYFWQETANWRDPKQQRFLPWRMLLPHTRRRPLRETTDYSFPLLAQGLADVIAEGGSGAIGAHGQHHGIGSHWEIWMAESALGAEGALDLATRQGASFLGLEHQTGTIETGKLADLVVLNRNPLEDLRATADILYVVKEGRVYDGDTLDEIWPDARSYGGYPWLDETMYREDERPVRREGAGGGGPAR